MPVKSIVGPIYTYTFTIEKKGRVFTKKVNFFLFFLKKKIEMENGIVHKCTKQMLKFCCSCFADDIAVSDAVNIKDIKYSSVDEFMGEYFDQLNANLEKVRKCPSNLRSIPQTDALCMAAVKQNGLALRHVRNATDAIEKAAFQQNVMALHYMSNQTDDLCLAAVQKNGLALQFVRHQTDQICFEALKQNRKAAKYVRNLTPELTQMLDEYLQKK